MHALRGVTLEVPVGQFTAVMGPSGSGKSTLMHLLAGLDRPTNGRVKIGDEDITEMPDKQLTKLRRRHIGFVFQSFNLLPMLTAEENILLPLSIAGRKADKAAVAVADRPRRPRRAPAATSRRSSPAASSSASRSPARSPRSRRCCSPTSRPATSTRPRAPRCSSCCARPSSSTARPRSWSPTTRARRPSADRVLFLADGLIVNDLAAPDEEQILAAMKEATQR